MMPVRLAVELGYGSNWTAHTGNRDKNMPENSDVNDLSISEGEKSCMEKKMNKKGHKNCNKNGNKNGKKCRWNKNTLRVLVGVFFGWGIQSARCDPKWIPFAKHPNPSESEDKRRDIRVQGDELLGYEPLFFTKESYQLAQKGKKEGVTVKVHEIGINKSKKCFVQIDGPGSLYMPISPQNAANYSIWDENFEKMVTDLEAYTSSWNLLKDTRIQLCVYEFKRAAANLNFHKVSSYKQVYVDDYDGRYELEHTYERNFSTHSETIGLRKDESDILTDSEKCVLQIRDTASPPSDSHFLSFSRIAKVGSLSNHGKIIKDFGNFVNQQDDKYFGTGVKEKLLLCVKKFNDSSADQKNTLLKPIALHDSETAKNKPSEPQTKTRRNRRRKHTSEPQTKTHRNRKRQTHRNRKRQTIGTAKQAKAKGSETDRPSP